MDQLSLQSSCLKTSFSSLIPDPFACYKGLQNVCNTKKFGIGSMNGNDFKLFQIVVGGVVSQKGVWWRLDF